MPCGCKEIIAGVVGMAKAVTGVDGADSATMSHRRDICRGCDRAEHRMSGKGRLALTTFSRCHECGCIIAAKTAIASEACPLGKW